MLIKNKTDSNSQTFRSFPGLCEFRTEPARIKVGKRFTIFIFGYKKDKAIPQEDACEVPKSQKEFLLQKKRRHIETNAVLHIPA